MRNVALYGTLDCFHRFFANRATADSYDSEYRLDVLEQSVNITEIVKRGDGDGALGALNFKIAEMLCAVAQIAAQGILKIAAICTLEYDFAKLTK